MHGHAIAVAACVAGALFASGSPADGSEPEAPLSLIVMDPLAGPLSCPCVEGYAQRRYEVLAGFLEKRLGRTVKLTFGESLQAAVKKSGLPVHVVIGKDSVVRADAIDESIDVVPIGRLTGLDGSTTQQGLIVVGRDDPAKKPADLGGYTIIFGPSEADEKHDAAISLLKKSGVDIPKQLTIDEACSDGACKVIDLGPKSRTAAVISSYAQPLLEGCGTIKKGDLRVIGKTQPVPFITAFSSAAVSKADRQQVTSALLSVATEPDVLEALESLVGFLPVEKTKNATPSVAKKK